MRRIIDWFKNLHLINRTYHRDMARMNDRITSCFATSQDVLTIIKERTDIHCDLHYKGQDIIICVGKFRGKDFVQVYNFQSRDFEHMIHHLRQYKRSANLRVVDCVPNLHSVVKRSFEL